MQTFHSSHILRVFHTFLSQSRITHAYKFDGQFYAFFREILILSVAIIISYLVNLGTPAALVQTTIELNLWMKYEHPTYKHIFSSAQSDISWFNKDDWISQTKSSYFSLITNCFIYWSEVINSKWFMLENCPHHVLSIKK